MIEYKKLNIVGKLIYINVAVYIVTQLYRLFLTLFCVSGFQWQDYLALHSNINYFLLTPWTVFTYFFTHADLGIDLLPSDVSTKLQYIHCDHPFQNHQPFLLAM